ncbi:MAG TPA: NAD(+)/NADH kinase, partial [Solirubrobacterales bacterium]|nr:NAD(+)/NADH kinase [Solirubrobacterales bacterium]
MKTAALITHSHPPAATEAVPIASAAAEAAGWRLVADQGELDKHGAEAAGVELERDDETPDLCLVLGGDGTILHALRRFAGTKVPVFGVNFGTVGFLAAVERPDARDGIARAFAGEVETIELPAVRVQAGGRSAIGFNDVTLQRRPHDRVAEL